MPKYYLFGTLLTHYGSASLNHDKSKGNTSPLQKAKWHNKIHSVVNSDPIRWALRYYWQQNGYPVNRNWDGDEFVNYWIDQNFDPEGFIDDDVLGYMRPEAARREVAEIFLLKVLSYGGRRIVRQIYFIVLSNWKLVQGFMPNLLSPPV